MKKRQFIKCRISELEEIFEESEYNEKLYYDLLHELVFRKRKNARALEREIEECFNAPSIKAYVGCADDDLNSSSSKKETEKKSSSDGRFGFLIDLLG